MAYCEKYVELISAAIDGALSPSQQEDLTAHLTSCPDCQALFDDLSTLHSAMADLPPAAVPVELKGHIMDAVAAEKVVPFASKKSSIHWRRWLASAAVLALVVMGTWSWKPWENRASDALPHSAEAGALDRGIGADATRTIPDPASAPMVETTSSPSLDSSPAELMQSGDSNDAPAAVAPKSAPIPEASSAVEVTGMAPANYMAKVSPGDGDAVAPSIDNETSPPSEAPALYGYSSNGSGSSDSESTAAAEASPPPQTSSVTSEDIPSLQTTVMPRLFSITPASQPLPVEEGVLVQAVTSQREAVDVLANYIYEFVGAVELVEDDPAVSYTINSPTGVSGVITCTDENEEVYFLNYRDDLSPEVLNYSVNKQTSEVTLLEQENGTTGRSVISRMDAVNALVNRFYDGQVEHVEVTEEEPGVRYAVGISPDAYWLGGASGVIVYVGEDEEVYFFDAKNDFSDQRIHLSVNKRTSEIIELEEEQSSAPATEESVFPSPQP